MVTINIYEGIKLIEINIKIKTPLNKKTKPN